MGDFKEEKGRLMKVDFDEHFGYKYMLWFDYTKKLMGNLKVGDLLAIPNFSDSEDDPHLSIVSVANVMPFHYAAGNDVLGYPTFEDQVREEAFLDFYKQADESLEETTKIQVIAAPTGLELKQTVGDGGGFRAQEETQIPMYGGQVSILENELVGKIFNADLKTEDCISIGTLTRGDVDIRVNAEDLVRTHIGIFGYTGTGKSNLSSTLIYKLLKEQDRPVKIVIFDLMGEYFALLADILSEVDGYFGYLEPTSLPTDLQEYMQGKGSLDVAASSLTNSIHIPSSLNKEDIKEKYLDVIKSLLDTGKIKVRYTSFSKIDQFLLHTPTPKGNRVSVELTNLNSELKTKFGALDYNEENLTKLKDFLNEAKPKSAGASQRVQHLVSALEKVDETFEPRAPHKMQIYGRGDSLLNDLLYGEKSGLYIIESESVDEIRKFSKEIICGGKYSVYGERRKHGYDHTKQPLVLFYFDEADEFIPQNPQNTYVDSTIAVETVARRGRKFGLGVCIATQRVTYLNTNIMAQPHTYLISKLPRKSDRERILEAFGISEDMLRETFKFRKGDWLLISHDATGMKGVPIPIHAPNAEERILSNLDIE